MYKLILMSIYNFFIKKKLKYSKNVIFGRNTYVNNKCIFEGNNIIKQGTIFSSSYVGFGSYIGSNCKFYKTRIGRFSCVASNIEVIIGNHPTKKFVSIHPIFYSKENPDLKLLKWIWKERNIFDEYSYTKNGYFCEIGNDVWIGSNVKIINGAKIGDGVIIAAGSVVTKDIPPYAIYGGVPAKLIRYRFSREQISFLLKIKWWDRDINWIKNNYEIFEDINWFYEKLKERENYDENRDVFQRDK